MAITPAIIRRNIARAEVMTRPIRTPVTHIHMIGRDAFGPKFADPVELSGEEAALVEDVGEGTATPQGTETISRTKLTFFFPLDVTTQDKFRLGSDETEWPVLKTESLRDPDNVPYMIEVWLGQAL